MKTSPLVIAVFGACLLSGAVSSIASADPSTEPTSPTPTTPTSPTPTTPSPTSPTPATTVSTTAASPKVTPQMIQNATIDLNANDATFGLDVADATVPLNTSSSDGDNQVIRLVSDLLFEFGSAELSATATSQLPTILADIPQAASIQVNGYTDSIGDDASNLTLSQQRAQAVATAIGGVRPDLVTTVNGHGEADPVAANTTADGSDNPLGRAENRRVEIVWQR